MERARAIVSRFDAPLLSIIGVGAALRVLTISRQSMWDDELRTVWLLRMSFGDMLDTIPKSEASPWLYYVLSWGWTRVFGFSDAAVRSLSAIAGIATIWVAYEIGKTLVSRRCGLLTAALAAVNPFLIWYSNEARTYALFAFLTGLSFLFFVRLLRGQGRRTLLWWALASAAAVAAHYFALFLLIPEGFWLLWTLRPRRNVLLAGLAPALVVLTELPLLLTQRRHTFGRHSSLDDYLPGGAKAHIDPIAGFMNRVAGVPKGMLVGYSFPFELAGSLVAVGLALVGIVLLVVALARGRLREARGVLVVALVAMTVPVVLGVVGQDYVLVRNYIPLVVPGLVLLSAGYASSRFGLVAGGALVALSLVIVLAVSNDSLYWRNDWRGAARVVEEGSGQQAIVVNPMMPGRLWRQYLDGAVRVERPALDVSEIVVIGLPTQGYTTGVAKPPEPEVRTPPPGFRLVEAKRSHTYSFVRYRADRVHAVPFAALEALRFGRSDAGYLVLIRPS